MNQLLILVKYFLWFIVYSFAGWAYESVICSINERSLVNRGFLNGPLCPVYGFGALASIFILDMRTDDLFILFFSGMLIACTVEYITAVLLEKLFDAKWWDYSNYRFNIQGRVCLPGAVVFGVLVVLLIKYIHPFTGGLLGQLSAWWQIVLSIVIFIFLMLDLYITVRHLLVLNSRLKKMQLAINQFLKQYAQQAGELKESLMSKFEESGFYNEHIKSLISLSRVQNVRIVRAFPRFRPINYNDAWQKLKSILLRSDRRN
ncbi:MAG: putative ABC transporter permease [Desulfosporosinus sp.]